MTKYKRFTGKVFGGTATATGNDPQISQFGSALAGTFIGTTDPEVIQSLPAWGQGWIGAVTPNTQFPALSEMTGAMKVLSHQICGIQQQGISDWDNGTIYYQNNFTAKNGKIYISQIDENQGNDPETDKVNWKEFSSGGGLEICDIGMSLYVDETKGLRRYLNGQIVDINTNTQGFLNRLKQITTLYPALLTTESEWQAENTLSKFGQVGKFVFNYGADGITVESVRIPRVVNIQGVFDLQNLGLRVDESLPDHKHTIIARRLYAQGSANYAMHGTGDAEGETEGVKDNSTYKEGAPVQQEAIQYPYFIQIATGSETENNIINDIELNNPFSLFDSKYSDHELNNLSWLKSEGQWNAKAVYTEAYDKLLKVYNGTETVEGLSVKLSTEEYTDYDFVLNTADETFRLPIKVKLASGKAVVGNGMAIGLTDGSSTLGLVTGSINYASGALSLAYGADIGTSAGNLNTANAQSTKATGLSSDPTKSGIETSDNGLYLYFYVGETVQNANLIDAGRIGESLANKVDINSKVIDGQWIQKYLSISNATTAGSRSHDLSDYLPNDGYIYEVMFEIYAAYDSSSASLCIGTTSSPHTNRNNCFSALVGVTSGATLERSFCILPIDNNRILYSQISAKLANSSIYLIGYRRVGTNV